MYAGAAILLVGFIVKFISPNVTSLEGRYRGLVGNPNALGIYVLMLFLTFALIRELYPDLFSNREKAVLYGLMFLSIILSNSRNSLFAILIFMFFSNFERISPYVGFIVFIVLLVLYQSIEANLASVITKLGLGMGGWTGRPPDNRRDAGATKHLYLAALVCPALKSGGLEFVAFLPPHQLRCAGCFPA